MDSIMSTHLIHRNVFNLYEYILNVDYDQLDDVIIFYSFRD